MKNPLSLINHASFLTALKSHISPHTVLITLLWILLIIVVNPVGEFPVNDDWSYTINAKALALDNTIVFDGWGAMTLFVHTLWGSLFCKLFGFSFTVLRISTLVMAWIGLLAFYRLCQTAGFTNGWSLAGTILLLINPFFFQNAFSYMTEVPFLTFLILSSIYSIRLFNTVTRKKIILASLFAILAILIRQTALVVPLALALASLITQRRWMDKLLGLIPAVATALSLYLFTLWRQSTFGLSQNFGKTSHILDSLQDGHFSKNLLQIGHVYFGLWGLFLLPLLLLSYYHLCKTTNRYVLLISKILTVGFFFIYVADYPYIVIGNTFENLHVGVLALPSASHITPTRIGILDWYNFQLVMFITALVTFQWIVIKIIEGILFTFRRKVEGYNATSLFATLIVVGYFLFLMLSYFKFDRYSLTAVPFLLLLLLPKRTSFWTVNKVFFVVSTAVIGIFTITATHDYMAWNRAYYAAVHYAITDRDAHSSQFDEDFKKHGLYVDELNKNEKTKQVEADIKYSFSFSPADSVSVVKKFPFSILLPPRVDTIYLEVKK